jgi:predicted dehydrogenase
MISRALVAGLGSIGQRHLRLLRAALPDADIRVLRHSGCDGAIEHADGCFSRLEDAQGFAPELAVIASPAPFHVATARALAEAGAHLLVEKPVSDGTAGVAELIALCADRGLVCQVGYNLRFLDTLQAFRAELAAGRIGAVQAVRCEIGQYLPGWRPGADYRTTVSAQRALGGGVILELSHELDMLRWIFGEVDWLSAWTGQQGALEIDVEDCVMIQMGFTGGPVAQLGMDFLRRDTTRTCTAIGETGSLRWDAVAGRVDHFDPGQGAWVEVTQVTPDRDACYRAQIAALLAAVAGRQGNIAAQGADGLAVMHLVEAVRRSDARQGLRVQIGDMT